MSVARAIHSTPASLEAMRPSSTTRNATLEEIKQWPATVDPATAARALGISRSYVYELLRQDRFPIKTIKVGRKTRVLTAALIAALEAA